MPRRSGFGLPKNKNYLIIIIIAVVGLVFYLRRKGTDSLPLGLGKDIDKFTSISRFGSSGSSGYTFPDGTPVPEKYKFAYEHVFKNNRDTTYPDDDTRFTDDTKMMIFIFAVKIIFSKSGNKNTTIIGGLSMRTFESQSDLDKYLDDLSPEDRKIITIWVIFMLKAYGKHLKPLYKMCQNSSSSTLSAEICKGMDMFAKVMYNLVNTDVYTGTKTNNGWDQYQIKDVSTTKDIDITPSINYNSKSIKNIALIFEGKEENGTNTPSQVIITVNDSVRLVIATAFDVNPRSFNYNIDSLLLDYPLVLTNLNIKLTCPGTSAAIKDFYLSCVYE